MMASTRLKESRSQVLFWLLNRNYRHVHRTALAERIEAGIMTITKGKRIPVNVVPQTHKINGKTVTVCAVAVGHCDVDRMLKKVVPHLEDALEGIEIRMASLRTSNKKLYEKCWTVNK